MNLVQRGLVGLAVMLIAVTAPAGLMADIAPAPVLSGSALTMTYEKVYIILYRDSVSVRANFTLEGKKIPKLTYCRVAEEDLKRHCSEPYYQFFYAYPVLKGQKFSQFLASADAKPVRDSDFGSPEAYGIKMPSLEGVEDWIGWLSERYPVTDNFKTDVSISYSEPKKMKEGRYQFTYVLRSGALWKGRIGRALIFVHAFSDSKGETLKLENCTIPPDKTVMEKGILYVWNERRDWEPDKDLTCDVRK